MKLSPVLKMWQTEEIPLKRSMFYFIFYFYGILVHYRLVKSVILWWKIHDTFCKKI